MKVAVLISGRGSNMQALIEAALQPGYPARVALVVSNILDAPGVAIARSTNTPVEILNHRSFATRESFERELDRKLTDYKIDLVCLAGFMRLLTPWFIERWYDKLLNIHPSLLPAYPGLETHKKAIADGVKFSGCTVLFVREKNGSGPDHRPSRRSCTTQRYAGNAGGARSGSPSIKFTLKRCALLPKDA